MNDIFDFKSIILLNIIDPINKYIILQTLLIIYLHDLNLLMVKDLKIQILNRNSLMIQNIPLIYLLIYKKIIFYG